MKCDKPTKSDIPYKIPAKLTLTLTDNSLQTQKLVYIVQRAEKH